MRTVTLLFGFCASTVLCVAQPTISGFTPVSAASGMTVTVNGANFTGATAVSFGGTPAASFTVVSPTRINAVVAVGTSGTVQVTTAAGTANRAGFIYISTSRIITDFGGLWESPAAAPNPVIPDDSHNLLAFTFYGTTYSTGVNDAALTANGTTYTAGNFRALPVGGITGITSSTTNTYLALGKKVDGSATVANTPAVSSYSVTSVLSDGVKGLNLGTGVTNLPTSAVLTFQISNIDPSKVTDSEPDIILTQIAQPVTGNDIYSFIDASGNIVGNSFTQNMTLLPRFGSYDLDLFNLTPGTPYNSATAYNAFAANTNREIRVIAVRLAEFGITPANVGQIRALRITPSGTSDYAFVAYNANAVNLPPNITQNSAATNTTICSGGTATMTVVGAAAAGGALSYFWEQSTNGGATWTLVLNGGGNSGATTRQLSVANALNGHRYRATVQEAGNGSTATSPAFAITVTTPTTPTSVSVSGTTTTCLNNAVQLTSAVTGGSNLTYQWQTDAGGSYQDVSGATLDTYQPPVAQTGVVNYRLRVSSGSGCPGSLTSSNRATVTVTGVSSVTSGSVCASGSVALAATATSGTIDWYTDDAGGSSLYTGNAFNTPVLSASRTYYISASGCASALRVPVQATVHPASNGGSIAGAGVVTPGINLTTLTLSGQTGTILRWQSSTDNFATTITDIANTTASLTALNLMQTTQYRTIVRSGTCNSVSSQSAAIVVTGPLPVNFKSIKAINEGTAIRVEWTAYDLHKTERFELEKATDGSRFTKVYTVAPTATSGAEVRYQWLDKQPASGVNSYRIKEVLRSGTVTYSSVVRIQFDAKASSLVVFPNPVSQHSFHVQRFHLAAGRYSIRLVNTTGQLIHKRDVVHAGGTFTQRLDLPTHPTPGIYHVEIKGTTGITEWLRVQIL